MLSLLDMLNAFKQVREELKNGNYIAAWESTLAIQQFLINTAKSLGFQAGPNDDTHFAECMGILSECRAMCEHLPITGPIGKLGDGKLLKILLDYLLVILPLIIKPTP